MGIKEVFRTAFRSLTINPLRAMLSITGVIFGIASVIALIAMGEGVRDQITKEIQNLGTNLLVVRSGEPVSETEGISASQIQMLSQPDLASSTLTVQDLETVRATEYIEDAYPMIQLVYEVEASEEGKGEGDKTSAFIKGTDEHYIEMNKIEVAHGRFLEEEVSSQEETGEEDGEGAEEGGDGGEEREPEECVLGTLVANILFGSTGDDVLGETVMIRYADPTAQASLEAGASPEKSRKFVVVGVMEERRSTVLNNPNLEMYIPVGVAQVLAGGFEDRVLEINAAVDSEENIDSARAALEEAIFENHGVESADFNIQTQDDLMNTYQYIFDVLTALVFGVAAISLVTGGVGVANIMYVSVKERTKEIGVRLAQGASKRIIIMQFLFESILLCMIGALIGIPLGIIVSLLINLSVLPATPTVWGVLVAFAAAFLVGVIAGVFPARQATRVEITEALRSEF